MKVFEEAFTAAWTDVPEAIRLRLPDDSRERIRRAHPGQTTGDER